MENQRFDSPQKCKKKVPRKASTGDILDTEDYKVKLLAKDYVVQELNKRNERLVEENERLKKDIKTVEKEKDEALSRLSKLAGEKLTEGNPAITDLGNPNRPAKIGERWSTLYTDEWTDAYEEIQNQNKRNSISDSLPERQLIKIVDWCYKHCIEIKENQNRKIKEKLWEVVRQIHLLGTEMETPVNDKHVDEKLYPVKSMLETMDTFLKNAKIQIANSGTLTEAANQKCVEDYKKANQDAMQNQIKFVKKCSELCWYICSSDPMMVIEYENFDTKPVDGSKFNKYNRTGTTVEFVVWPVLLLHKDGPVLAKGTVQTNQVPRHAKQYEVNTKKEDKMLNSEEVAEDEEKMDEVNVLEMNNNHVDKLMCKENTKKVKTRFTEQNENETDKAMLEMTQKEISRLNGDKSLNKIENVADVVKSEKSLKEMSSCKEDEPTPNQYGGSKRGEENDSKEPNNFDADISFHNSAGSESLKREKEKDKYPPPPSICGGQTSTFLPDNQTKVSETTNALDTADDIRDKKTMILSVNDVNVEVSNDMQISTQELMYTSDMSCCSSKEDILDEKINKYNNQHENKRISSESDFHRTEGRQLLDQSEINTKQLLDESETVANISHHEIKSEQVTNLPLIDFKRSMENFAHSPEDNRSKKGVKKLHNFQRSISLSASTKNTKDHNFLFRQASEDMLHTNTINKPDLELKDIYQQHCEGKHSSTKINTENGKPTAAGKQQNKTNYFVKNEKILETPPSHTDTLKRELQSLVKNTKVSSKICKNKESTA